MRLILVPALLGIFFVCVPASSGQKSTPDQPDISRSGLDFLEVCSSVDSEGTGDAVRAPPCLLRRTVAPLRLP